MMITIRLLMNGEVPPMAPVTGSRRGAPCGTVSSAIAATTARNAPERPAQALGLGVRERTFRLIRPRAVVGAEPRLDHALGDHARRRW